MNWRVKMIDIEDENSCVDSLNSNSLIISVHWGRFAAITKSELENILIKMNELESESDKSKN